MKSYTITPAAIDNARAFQEERNAERVAKGKLPASATKFNMPSGHLHLNLEIDLDAGSYCWRYVYNRPTGELARYSMGVYPFKAALGKKGDELKAARKLQDRDIARACAEADAATSQLAHGEDPGKAKQKAKHQKAVAQVTRAEHAELVKAKKAVPGSFRWYAEKIVKHHAMSWSDTYKKTFLRTLAKWAYPCFEEGNIAPRDITAEMVAKMREDAYWKGGKLVGEMVGQPAAMDQVTGFYLQTMVEAGIAKPVMPVEREGKFMRLDTEHHPAITEPALIGKLLIDLLRFKGHQGARDGCLVGLLTGQRTNIIHRMEWTEIDWKACTWTIPRPKGKGKTILKFSEAALKNPQVVPLSTQVMGMLERIEAAAKADAERKGTPMSKWVFPSRKRGATTGCMDKGTMGHALRQLGYQDEHDNHGSRTTFRSAYCDYRGEQWGLVCEAIIEHKWGEVTKKQTSGMGGTYRRVSLDKRREVLQDWGNLVFQWGQDYLEREAASPAIANDATPAITASQERALLAA